MVVIEINMRCWVRVVIFMYENAHNPLVNKTYIAKKLNISYSQMNKLVVEFEKRNIIKGEIIGRERKLSLTEQGVVIAKSLLDIEKLLQEGGA